MQRPQVELTEDQAQAQGPLSSTWGFACLTLMPLNCTASVGIQRSWIPTLAVQFKGIKVKCDLIWTWATAWASGRRPKAQGCRSGSNQRTAQRPRVLCLQALGIWRIPSSCHRTCCRQGRGTLPSALQHQVLWHEGNPVRSLRPIMCVNMILLSLRSNIIFTHMIGLAREQLVATDLPSPPRPPSPKACCLACRWVCVHV